MIKRMQAMMVVKVISAGAILLGAGVFLAAGCKKKTEAQYPPPQSDAGYAAWDSGAPVQDAGTTTPDAAPVPEAAPEPTFDEVTKAQLAAQIAERAKTEAPGMKPVGEVFGGVAKDGGTVESAVFQIDLAKCYSVVAQGGLGVSELDIQLKGAQILPGMQPTLAVDNTSGPSASINPCWKNGFPVGFPATVSLVVRTGSGPVAAQIFVK